MTDYAGRRSRTPQAFTTERAREPVPGKQTLVERVYASTVQRRATGSSDEAAIHAAASRGTATAAGSLPYADAIQRSFGHHDISSVQAHTGADAAMSARAMGAAAYATGNHVVLDHGADLFTVAHEAAHVIQQRGGVQLRGGVGEAGDPYERHADEVAALVVQGKSAAALLDGPAGARGGGHGAGPASVQCKRYELAKRPGFHGVMTPQGHGKLLPTLKVDELKAWLVEAAFYDREDWEACCLMFDREKLYAITSENPELAQRLLVEVPPKFRDHFVAPQFAQSIVEKALAPIGEWEQDTEFMRHKSTVISVGVSEGIWLEAVKAARLYIPMGSAASAIGKFAAYIARLYHLLNSVLKNGVMSPAKLVELGIVHSSSSDGGQPSSTSSFFDLDLDRNTNGPTRYGKPGLSSLSVMIERQYDVLHQGMVFLQLARADPERRKMLLNFAQGMGEDVAPNTLDQLIDKVLPIFPKLICFKELGFGAPVEKLPTQDEMRYVNWFTMLGQAERFSPRGMLELAERARAMAMVVSTGERREGSELAKAGRPKEGPDTRTECEELRTGVPMKPDAITHVILPWYMRGFSPAYDWPVELRFTGITSVQIGYFDQSTQTKKDISLKNVMDLQTEIDNLQTEGHRKMITHSTHY